jgi:diguanylate cyclase (GGDEF)-like protein
VDDWTKYSRQFHIAAGLITVLILGLVDYVTGPATSLLIFYLVPIVQVTWFGGQVAGIATALSSAAIWLLGELALDKFQLRPTIPVWNIVLVFVFFLAVAAGLSVLRDRLRRVSKFATTDPLTGLPNAQRFREIVQVEKDRALRYTHPLTIACIDVDDFKEIDVRFGRSKSDALLRTVATTIQDGLRSSDTVARLGDGEFGTLLVEADVDEVQPVIIRIRQNLLAAMQKNGWPVTFSAGAVTFYHPSSSVEEMIHTAAALLGVVKGEGGDSVRFEVYSD